MWIIKYAKQYYIYYNIIYILCLNKLTVDVIIYCDKYQKQNTLYKL